MERDAKFCMKHAVVVVVCESSIVKAIFHGILGRS
jgi:hypothetical protein